MDDTEANRPAPGTTGPLPVVTALNRLLHLECEHYVRSIGAALAEIDRRIEAGGGIRSGADLISPDRTPGFELGYRHGLMDAADLIEEATGVESPAIPPRREVEP